MEKYEKPSMEVVELREEIVTITSCNCDSCNGTLLPEI